jgi:hypothetical protein
MLPFYFDNEVVTVTMRRQNFLMVARPAVSNIINILSTFAMSHYFMLLLMPHSPWLAAIAVIAYWWLLLMFMTSPGSDKEVTKILQKLSA